MWPVLFSWAFFLSGSPVSVLSQIVTVEDSDKAGYKTTKPGRVCRAGVVKIVWLKTYEICLFNKSARMAGLEPVTSGVTGPANLSILIEI